MTDLEWAERFLGRFALPLVHGAAVQVGVPLARRGAERLLAAISGGLDGTVAAEALAEARQRRLLELVPVISAPRLFEDRSAALLLVALHDLLFLHHPAAARLSEHQAALLHGFTLQLIGRAAAQLPRVATRLPETGGEARLPTGAAEPRRLALAAQRLLGRHSLLVGVFRLWRADTRAPTFWGERDYRGVTPPPARLRALLGRARLALPERRHVRLLPELLARRDSAVAVRALLAASPLTALLPPVGVGLLPELAGQAAWLRLPAVARLVVARYLSLGAGPAVAEAGEAVGALLRQRERALLSSDLMTLLCLVSHLHVCVALSETPLPAAELAGPAADSYALYAVVAARWPLLCAPQDVLCEPRLNARLQTYLLACRAAAGAARLRELDELCLDALAAGPTTGENPAPRTHEEPDVGTRSLR